LFIFREFNLWWLKYKECVSEWVRVCVSFSLEEKREGERQNES
jgi:hypothetical protein